MIEFKNVSFAYPDSTDGGLKNIDLTIPDGQCVLLCGRSGCGKTTLTRLVNGLIPQFFAGNLSGEILLDGENLADLPMYRIAEKVGSVFQNPRTQFFNGGFGFSIPRVTEAMDSSSAALLAAVKSGT